MKRPLFTEEELADSRKRDQEIALSNKSRKERKRAETQRRYYEENKEKIADYQRRYREAKKRKKAAAEG